jgi:hypothetical protein
MAYTLFTEVADGRQATVDSKFNRTYTRVFLVRTDSPTYGPVYAGSHPSLPLIFSAYPDDANAFCLSLSPAQDQNDPLLWRVTAQYGYNTDMAATNSAPSGNPAVDTQQQGQSPASRVANPLSRPRDYSISTNAYPWAIEQDRFGNPLQNSAGDPFIPVPEIQKGGATITVGLNSTSSPSAAWINAIGYLNAISYTVGPYVIGAGLAKLNAVSASLAYENGVNYWRWQLTFEYRPDGWAWVVANKGKRQVNINDPAGPLIEIMSKAGGVVSNPVYLDASGYALLSSGARTYATYHIYPRVAFPSL